MKIRWILCLLTSLAIHVAWLNLSSLTQDVNPQPAGPSVAVIEAEPPLPPPAELTAQPEPSQPKPQPQPITQINKFRPNVEEDDSKQDQEQESAEDSPSLEEDQALPAERSEPELAKTDVAEKPDYGREVGKYRTQLLAEFQDQWQKVPDLNTVIKDLTALPRIDRHFGIVILAYSFVDHKPGPPFIVFDTSGDAFEQVDTFDFSSFSNRIKDRMLYSQYRKRLEHARKERNISSLMKVVGLVPIETDHYFSAKQLRAVQLAGVNLEKAAATNCHYELDGSGGYGLIVDAVVTTDGRTIEVRDEELRFSVVATNSKKGRS